MDVLLRLRGGRPGLWTTGNLAGRHNNRTGKSFTVTDRGSQDQPAHTTTTTAGPYTFITSLCDLTTGGRFLILCCSCWYRQLLYTIRQLPLHSLRFTRLAGLRRQSGTRRTGLLLFGFAWLADLQGLVGVLSLLGLLEAELYGQLERVLGDPFLTKVGYEPGFLR